MTAADREQGGWTMTLSQSTWDDGAGRVVTHTHTAHIDYPDADIDAVMDMAKALVLAVGFHHSSIEEYFHD